MFKLLEKLLDLVEKDITPTERQSRTRPVPTAKRLTILIRYLVTGISLIVLVLLTESTLKSNPLPILDWKITITKNHFRCNSWQRNQETVFNENGQLGSCISPMEIAHCSHRNQQNDFTGCHHRELHTGSVGMETRVYESMVD